MLDMYIYMARKLKEEEEKANPRRRMDKRRKKGSFRFYYLRQYTEKRTAESRHMGPSVAERQKRKQKGHN